MMRAFSWVPSKYGGCPILIDMDVYGLCLKVFSPSRIAIYELATQSILLYLSCMRKCSFLLARANLNIYK